MLPLRLSRSWVYERSGYDLIAYIQIVIRHLTIAGKVEDSISLICMEGAAVECEPIIRSLSFFDSAHSCFIVVNSRGIVNWDPRCPKAWRPPLDPPWSNKASPSITLYWAPKPPHSTAYSSTIWSVRRQSYLVYINQRSHLRRHLTPTRGREQLLYDRYWKRPHRIVLCHVMNLTRAIFLVAGHAH